MPPPFPWPRLIFGLLLITAGSALIGFFGWLAVSQHYRLIAYHSVPAQIVTSETRSQSAGHGNRVYSAQITYTYEVSGKQYKSQNLLPVMDGYSTSNRDWVRAVSRKYPEDTTATAYYSPINPADAFLVRDVIFIPYLFALCPSVLFAVGWTLIAASLKQARQPAPPASAGNGWYKIPEEQTLAASYRHYRRIAVAWSAFWLLLLGDYFFANGFRLDFAVLIMPLICIAVGIFPMLMAWRYLRLRHDFLDASVFIDRPLLRAGDTVTFRLNQDLLQPLTIEEVSIGPVCQYTHQYRTPKGGSAVRTSEFWNDRKPLLTRRTGGAISQISGQTTVSIPADAHPTGRNNAERLPIYQWFIELRIKCEAEPRLDVRFPILLHPQPQVAPNPPG